MFSKLNLNKGQKKEPFWLTGSMKMLSSKAEGTRRTLEETTFLTTFLDFLRLI
jgi:hypothetical protein